MSGNRQRLCVCSNSLGLLTSSVDSTETVTYKEMENSKGGGGYERDFKIFFFFLFDL